MSKDTTPTYKPGSWRVGTVSKIQFEAMGVRSYTFSFDTPVSHEAGQHYELRLTAEDSYQAARLYSAAMPANGTSNMLQLTIALMEHGEISPYLFNYVTVGSQLEIRGPFGRHFVWTEDLTEPLLMIGGGTGVIPLRAMRLQHQYAESPAPLKLVYSAHSYYDVLYKYEFFPRGGQPEDDIIMTFTEQPPDGWTGYKRRIDKNMLQEVINDIKSPRIYVCGPTPFVESVTGQLVDLGQDPARIKAERFGPTTGN